LYKPVSMLVGILDSIIAGLIFKRVWTIDPAARRHAEGHRCLAGLGGRSCSPLGKAGAKPMVPARLVLASLSLPAGEGHGACRLSDDIGGVTSAS
jgi:hypothetical protein